MTKRALSPLASAAAASKKTATEATLSTLTTTATDSQPLLRIASWNITSFKSCVKNGGLMDFIGKESPDILALQETKLNNADDAKDIVPHSIYPYQYFHCCSAKKGYAGSAVFSKIKPLCVTNGFLGGGGGGGGGDDDELTDNEGRLITLEFDRAAVVASYVPNASQGLKRLDWKTDIWNRGLTEHFKVPVCDNTNL
jgi:AP endonuclease-1